MIDSLRGCFLLAFWLMIEAMGSIPIRFSDDTDGRVIAGMMDVLPNPEIPPPCGMMGCW